MIKRLVWILAVLLISSQAAQAIGQPDAGRGFAFTGRRRVDGGDQDQLAGRSALHPPAKIHRDLGPGLAVEIQVIFGDTQLGRHGLDGQELGLPGDFEGT